MKNFIFYTYFIFLSIGINSQTTKILSDKSVADKNYLPDFSFAGYQNSNADFKSYQAKHILNATEYGVISNDAFDDSKALVKCIEAAEKLEGSVQINFPKGKVILSDIIFIRRSNILLKGAGSDENGTVLYFPRPMQYLPDTETLAELREYLISLNKRQVEIENNIDLPFSQYAWAGGFIWTDVKGEQVKTYLEKYDRPRVELAKITKGNRGESIITIDKNSLIKVGDVVELQWFNREGENGSIIKELYPSTSLKPGSHHWKYPNYPIVKQQVRVLEIKNNVVKISSPLLMNCNPNWFPTISEWKHLENVGIENFLIEFPKSPKIAHHVEMGYNAIYLTRLYDGWVNNVKIKNADSGILTEEIANVTIENVETFGESLAHYTVHCGGVHNVLCKNITVKNRAAHPLSFNTYSTKSVFSNCEIFIDPILDQHSGANHQNLFDNIITHVSIGKEKSYPLFAGGGAPYWKPSHGAYSTFYNIKVVFEDLPTTPQKILLNGMADGASARVIGVSANVDIAVEYGPDAYLENIGVPMKQTPSLFDYQLNKRKKK